MQYPRSEDYAVLLLLQKLGSIHIDRNLKRIRVGGGNQSTVGCGIQAGDIRCGQLGSVCFQDIERIGREICKA